MFNLVGVVGVESLDIRGFSSFGSLFEKQVVDCFT